MSVPKTPYELWTGREHSLNYLCAWDCPAEAKVLNPNIGKLDSKTVSCHFIGYTDKLKGYRFYCPNRHTKFIEMRHAVFLEDEIVRGSMIPQEKTESVVSSPVATMNKNQEPVLQEPIETVVAHLEELQQPYMEDVPNVEALKSLKELENQSCLMTMKSILVKKLK